jgi:hypothetical protein
MTYSWLGVTDVVQDGSYSPEQDTRLLKTCFKLERMGFEVFNYRKALSIYGRDTILALTYASTIQICYKIC